MHAFAFSRICKQAVAFLLAFAFTSTAVNPFVISFALAHIHKPHAFAFIRSCYDLIQHHLHLLAFTRLIKKAAFVCIRIYWLGTEGDISHLVELDCLHLHSHLHLLKRAQLPLVEWVSPKWTSE